MTFIRVNARPHCDTLALWAIIMAMCWYCGSAVTDTEPLGRSLRCPECGRDLRSCKNCKFYLPGNQGDCSESQGEHPSDTERGNFCDWFSLNPQFKVPSAGQKSAQESAVKARSAFDSLFGS